VLLELRTSTQALVDAIDPVEEGLLSSKTLVERFREAPQKLAGYLTESSKQYVAQVLGLFNSYRPGEKIALLGDGMSNECDDDTFTKYVEEVELVAEQIVKMLEQ